MVIDHKPPGCQSGKVARASVDVKYSVALLALKVMVMLVMLHQLESWALAR